MTQLALHSPLIIPKHERAAGKARPRLMTDIQGSVAGICEDVKVKAFGDQNRMYYVYRDSDEDQASKEFYRLGE